MKLAITLAFAAFVPPHMIVGGFRFRDECRQSIDLPNERSVHVLPAARGGG